MYIGQINTILGVGGKYLFMDSKLVIIRVKRNCFRDFYFFKFVGGLNSSFLIPYENVENNSCQFVFNFRKV